MLHGTRNPVALCSPFFARRATGAPGAETRRRRYAAHGKWEPASYADQEHTSPHNALYFQYLRACVKKGDGWISLEGTAWLCAPRRSCTSASQLDLLGNPHTASSHRK
ncbi:UNVERIFIED_CONTAM: hypothetical protein K2H54_008019 [Gekko kuhli]